MEWLNIRLTQLAAPEYLRSDPTERATWLQLLAHCAGQENGGILRDCHDWKDRVWQQVCGITHREAHTPTRLWTWENTDLHIWGYPLDKERMVQQKRSIGAVGGRQSGKARAQAPAEPDAEPDAEAYASADAPPNAEADPNPLLERKGREGKGMEGKEQQLQLQPPTLDRGIDLNSARDWADGFNRGNTEGSSIPMPVITAWHDDRQSKGWTTVRDGTEFPIRDWQADLRVYARKWHQNERSPRPISAGRQTPAKPIILTTKPVNGF